MNSRPRIAFDPAAQDAAQVRLWLLQLGTQPIDHTEPAASELPQAPQHPGVTRAEVTAFVHAIKGAPSKEERFDDHGSGESWPRGSF